MLTKAVPIIKITGSLWGKKFQFSVSQNKWRIFPFTTPLQVSADSGPGSDALEKTCFFLGQELRGLILVSNHLLVVGEK